MVTKFPEDDVLEGVGDNHDVEMAEAYPKPREDLLDFLYRCKEKGSQVSLCPRCSAITDKQAADNYQRLQWQKKKKAQRYQQRFQYQRNPRQVVGNYQPRPRTFVPPANVPRGVWIQPQGRMGRANAAEANKGKAAVTYRHESKTEKKTRVSENYMGKKPHDKDSVETFPASEES